MSEERPFYELPLSYPAPGLPEVWAQRDIPYLESGDPVARLDIYRPGGEPPDGGYPLVMFLHGGPLPADGGRPWPKEWRVFQDYGRLIAANGLAAAVINHRYSGYEGLSRAGSDALEAAGFLREHGQAYGLDGDRLALWAFSGAGMLLSPFLRGEAGDLRSLVAFYPMVDLTHVPQALDVFSEEQLIALSPIAYVEAISPALPLLLVRAGLDRPGLNRGLDTFVKQALYHNLDLELRNLPAAGHGFDMLESGAAGRAAVRRALDFLIGHGTQREADRQVQGSSESAMHRVIEEGQNE
jgi:acetyl esterase/lipase